MVVQLFKYNPFYSLLMNSNTGENEQVGSVAEQGMEGQQEAQKSPLYFYDHATTQWFIHPYYQQFFMMQLEIVEQLKQTINQKWTEQQRSQYLRFLGDLQAYITSYIFGFQVPTFEDYLLWREAVKPYNPIGFDLYEKQLDYMQKVSEGYDFKLDKKKNKDPNAPKVEQKKREEKPAEEKQRVIARANDPEINIQKLMAQDWDPKKYLSTSFLAKENANIVFIGHVDSGKSTLTGNIMRELKQVDEQELAYAKRDAAQNKMESWEQAGISDVIPEEREDGKTREFAKLNFSLEKKRFTLFDAPGHKNYVPNMIMGACQADIAVLIISAKEGEFESGFEKDGQTKEHAMLAKALGVCELIAVVTKMGTVGWKEDRFKHIQNQVSPFLENSCGFNKVVFIPVESIENVNIHTRISDSWYKGPSFLEYLDNVGLPERKPLGPLRIPVIDKFKEQGNFYIYGKIESGSIVEDQVVTLLPQRTPVSIKEIYNAKDQRLPFACAGQNLKLKVKGLDDDDVGRGDVICNNLNYCQESSEFKANITILELPETKKLVSNGYECILHMHAIASQAQIQKVEAKIIKETGKKAVATFLRPGDKGICVIKVERPVCLEKHEFMPCLGRFTLRDQGKTIGYGEITGIKPAKKLFKEQEEQLVGDKKEKKEVQNLTKELAKTEVSKAN